MAGLGSNCTDFEQVARLWQRLRQGDDGEPTELACALGVEVRDVERGLCAARTWDEPELLALVGTLSARIDFAGEGEGARLEKLRLEVLWLSDALPGFRDVYVRYAAKSLPERPRLAPLRGRARLLEELRRDLLREPQVPLPESLQELLDDLPLVEPLSPPILGLDGG